MLVSSLETLLATLLDPHPELVAATRPTPAQVLEAADYLGFFPTEADRLDWPLLRGWVASGGV